MRKYNFKLVSQICRGCGVEFKRHSNAKYCTETCQEKKSTWALRRQEKRISNLEFFLKEKILRAGYRSKYKVEIEYNDLICLWESQKGLCALTGIPMTFIKGSGKVPTNVSLDRIDSTKDYTKDNIQLVCSQVNFIKQDLTQEQLKYWIRAILAYEQKSIAQTTNTQLSQRIRLVPIAAGADSQPVPTEPSAT